MKTSVQLIKISVFALVAQLAMAEPPPVPLSLNFDSDDRPIGIDAYDWIPVSDKLGFVVLKTVEAADARPASCTTLLRAGAGKPPMPQPGYCDPSVLASPVQMPAAPAVGYFVIKTANGWRRLVVVTPADLSVAKQ